MFCCSSSRTPGLCISRPCWYWPRPKIRSSGVARNVTSRRGSPVEPKPGRQRRARGQAGCGSSSSRSGAPVSARWNERWTASAIAVVPTSVWRTTHRIRPVTRSAPDAWTRSSAPADGGAGSRSAPVQAGSIATGAARTRMPSAPHGSTRRTSSPVSTRSAPAAALSVTMRAVLDGSSETRRSVLCSRSTDWYAANMGIDRTNCPGTSRPGRSTGAASWRRSGAMDRPLGRPLRAALSLAKPTVSDPRRGARRRRAGSRGG